MITVYIFPEALFTVAVSLVTGSSCNSSITTCIMDDLVMHPENQHLSLKQELNLQPSDDCQDTLAIGLQGLRCACASSTCMLPV